MSLSPVRVVVVRPSTCKLSEVPTVPPTIFSSLIIALCCHPPDPTLEPNPPRHFYSDELQGSNNVTTRDDKHIVNVFREIVKLAYITRITQEWVLDIDITQPLAKGFSAILRKIFFGSRYRNDMATIAHIVEAMNHIPHSVFSGILGQSVSLTRHSTNSTLIPVIHCLSTTRCQTN